MFLKNLNPIAAEKTSKYSAAEKASAINNNST